MSDALIRTFVAVELPEDVKRALARTISLLRERAATPDIKWVSADNIHITLKFLGETPASRIDAIRDSLAPVCAAASPMRLVIAGLGSFPPGRSPRVVWAGLEGDTGALSALARGVEQALAPLGFAPEMRAFTPHLTLARVRPEATAQAQTGVSEAIAHTHAPQHHAFEATAAAIMRSRLMPTGAQYTRLASLAFGSAANHHR